MNDISNHFEYFNSLVELIPAKFYLHPTEDDDLLGKAYQKRSKKDKAAVKQIRKQAKKDKVTGEYPTTVEKIKAREAPSEDEHPVNLASSTSTHARSISELRERLQQKIKDLSQNRKHCDSREALLEERKIKKQKLKQKKKQENKQQVKQEKPKVAEKPVELMQEQEKSNDQSEPMFSKTSDEQPARKKQKLDPKSALKKVEALNQKLASKPQEKVAEIQDKQKWAKTFALAEGKKMQDDVKLLKKTIKRKDAIKKKSKKEWDERLSKISEQKADKQKKRNENIKKRIDEKKQKQKRRKGF